MAGGPELIGECHSSNGSEGLKDTPTTNLANKRNKIYIIYVHKVDPPLAQTPTSEFQSTS